MPRSLDDVIEDLGVGCCQVRLCCFAGGIYHMGGEYLFLLGVFPTTIGQEWGLESYERASLGSAVFLGMLGGNVAGFLNDSLGRRKPILVAFSCMLLFAGCSVLAQSVWTLFFMWSWLGFAYGIAVPTWNALFIETTPSDWRWCINSVSMLVYCAGALRGATMVYLHAPDLVSVGQYWRHLMIGACVANSVLLALAVVPGFVDSPRFLVNQNRVNEAREQLEVMRSQNGRSGVSLEFSEEHLCTATSMRGMISSLGVVFSRNYWYVTLVVGLTTFLLNFMKFGQYYSLPQVLGAVDLGMSPALSLIVAVFFEISGYGLGMALDPYMGRKGLTTTYLAGAGMCTVLFIWGLETLKPSEGTRDHALATASVVAQDSGVALVHAGLYGSRLFMSIGWVASYTYAGEVFPTSARASGSGVCLACGRIGSLSAPWVFEHLLERTGTYLWYFVVCGLLCLVNGTLVLVVLKETKGAQLDEWKPLSAVDHDAATKVQ